MKRTFKIVGKIPFCILVCLITSIPFAIIVKANVFPPYPYPIYKPENDSLFRIASILFFVEHILSLAGVFLAYVKSIENVTEVEGKGCALFLLGAVSAFSNYLLCDHGEFVAVYEEYSSYVLTSHEDISAAGFWAAIAVVYLGILFAAVMLSLGKFSDD